MFIELVLNLWECPLFLVQPSILKLLSNQTMEKSDSSYILSDHKSKYITFGTFGNQSVIVTQMLKKFQNGGFDVVHYSDAHPDTLQLEPKLDQATIITHIFLEHKEYNNCSIHVVVFYERKGSFLWHSQLPTTISDIAFGSHAGAYDRFNLEKRKIDNIEILTPMPIATFLKQESESEFIECNYTRSKEFYSKYPKDTSEKGVMFQERARNLLSKSINVLDELGIRFWISSGIALGWFRQCDIPTHTYDLDVGMLWTDYIPEIITACEKAGLELRWMYGQINDSFELTFRYEGARIDMFMYYVEGDTMWSSCTIVKTGEKYKYILPKFRQCWTTLLDLKIRVPCPTEPYVKAYYGNDWFEQKKNWHLDSNPNLIRNGFYPKEKLNDFVKHFV